MTDVDQQYLQARRYVQEYRDTSCAGLQRHLRIGYQAALQLRERLSAAGVYEGIRSVTEPVHWTIRAVGMGGAGCNALDVLLAAPPDRVEAVALRRGNERGTLAEDIATIDSALEGASLVFVAVGLSGGFGARMASLAVQAARRAGTPCIVTAYMPAPYEGAERCARAAALLPELVRDSDAVLVSSLAPRCPSEEAGSMVDLLEGRNREFATLVGTLAVLLTDDRAWRPTLNELLLLLKGRLWMGAGRSAGADAVAEATREACSQLLGSGACIPADTLFAVVRTHPSARFIRPARVTDAAEMVAGPRTRVSVAYQQDERLGGSVEIILLAARRAGC